MRAIEIRHLSKKYPIYAKPSDKLKEWVWLGRKRYHEEFWALKDLDLEVEHGETVGLIGRNGSGKSTLLQLVTGILRPTRGEVTVRGKVSALLELGSGFNPEFTGRENVFMYGAIMGVPHVRMKERFPQVARFAEIGDFIEQPVKTYSSGMFMRLAFAAAIHVDPEILLVDEVLAVGDLIFQHRCVHKIRQLRSAGVTILFVTHDLHAVTEFCDRAVLLEGGRKAADGKPEHVVQKYRALIFEKERKYSSEQQGTIAPPREAVLDDLEPVTHLPNVDHRYGNGKARILGIDLLGRDGGHASAVDPDLLYRLRISAQFLKAVEHPILGYTIRDRLGVDICASNTAYEGCALPTAAPGDVYTVDFHLRFPPLRRGSYSVSPAVASGSVWEHEMCDWIDNAFVFDLESAELIYGVVRIPNEVRFSVRRSAPQD